MRNQAFLISPSFILVFTTILQANIINVPADSSTIQAGINGSADGDTVLVADGTYTGDGNWDIDFLGKAIVVMSERGPENCVIDGGSNIIDPHRGFYFHSGEDSNSVVQGFTIESGIAPGDWLANYGGGIYCESSSPTIHGNVITKCAAAFGSGIYCANGSSPNIVRNRINNNYADMGGGGIHCGGSSPHIIGNTITEHWAVYGAGISCRNSSPTITGNTITSNDADAAGSGIYCWTSAPVIINTILWGNEQAHDGGKEIYLHEQSTLTISYSDVEGGQDSVFVDEGSTLIWGDGMMDEDPLFRDVDTGDYQLMAIACGDSTDSPGIDTGHPDSMDVILDCEHGLGAERSDIGAFGGRNSTWWVGIEKDQEKEADLIRIFTLLQNYPNPFNPTTTISFDILGKKHHTTLTVYDLRGRHVKTLVDEDLNPGTHKVVWDGRDGQWQRVSSGIYLYTLKSGDQIYTRKMVVVE